MVFLVQIFAGSQGKYLNTRPKVTSHPIDQLLLRILAQPMLKQHLSMGFGV